MTLRLSAEQRRRLPNVLVIGAGKSGTSSLHRYLDLHPAIAMTATKELNFFNRADCFDRLEWYLGQFDPAHEVRGESSPSYAQFPRLRGQPERIHRLVPDAKLIYLVRDPIDRSLAHWAQQTAVGAESRPLAEVMRTLQPLENLYVCASLYATQVEQFLEHFPQERLLVIDQHELRHQRRDVMQRVFSFLGVDASFWSSRFEVEVKTQADQRRLSGFGQALRSSPLAGLLGALPAPARERFGDAARRLLSKPVERPECDAELRARLQKVFEPEARRLRELTGMTFPHWSL